MFFVTRLRDFSRVEILKPHSRPNDPAIQSDQVVRIGSQRYRMKEDLRLVTVTGADGESVLFVTNIWHLAASTISAIYRDRWQIEVFFRALKQNLRVKSFVGTSQNAVQIANLDSTHRSAADQVSATAIQLRLVALQSGCFAAPAAICLPGLVDVARRAL